MNKIKLTNVRLSFPQLFEPKGFQDNPDLKYSAQFLLDKKTDKDQIDLLRKEALAVANEKWIHGATKVLPKGIKYCVGDGDEKDYESHQGKVFISASSNMDFPPGIVDQLSRPLTKENGRNKIYAGCYVNAYIAFWAQDNTYGKRINANLLGVQFAKDGEPFGQKPFNAIEEFEPLERVGDESPAELAFTSVEEPLTPTDDDWAGERPF
jgi:hypothetical protein